MLTDKKVNDFIESYPYITEESVSYKGSDNSFFKRFDEKVASMDTSSVNFGPALSEEEVIGILGPKWKHILARLFQMIERYEHITRNDRITALHLPTTDSYLRDLYGSPQNVHLMIQKAVNVNLLKRISDKKHFDRDGDISKSYGYIYAWNKEMQRILKEMCFKYDLVRKPNYRKSIYEDLQESNFRDLKGADLDESYLKERIHFGKRMRVNKTVSDDQVAKVIISKHPIVASLGHLCTDINKALSAKENRVRFRLNIHRTQKYITSVGGRASYAHCNMRTKKNMMEVNNSLYYREDYLNEVFKDGWREEDIKSSVPRITYYLNHNGEWLDDSVDLYAKWIYGDNRVLQKEERENIKSLFMRFYFDFNDKTALNNMERCHRLDHFYSRHTKDEARECIADLKSRMNKELGPSHDSLIFIVESFIYETAHRILIEECEARNLPNPVLVYDAFYVDSRLDIDVKKLVALVAELVWPIVAKEISSDSAYISHIRLDSYHLLSFIQSLNQKESDKSHKVSVISLYQVSTKGLKQEHSNAEKWTVIHRGKGAIPPLSA